MTARVVSLLSPRLFYEDPWRSTVSLRCPRCGTPLIRQTLSLVPAFQCHECQASLRISRVYGLTARILSAAVALAVSMFWGPTVSNFFSLALMFCSFYHLYATIIHNHQAFSTACRGRRITRLASPQMRVVGLI